MQGIIPLMAHCMSAVWVRMARWGNSILRLEHPEAKCTTCGATRQGGRRWDKYCVSRCESWHPLSMGLGGSADGGTNIVFQDVRVGIH